MNNLADPFVKKYPVIQKPNESGTGLEYTFFLLDEIGAPHEFAEVITVLQEATAEDLVTVKLNSPGGYVDSTIMLMDAFRACKAPVGFELLGEAASAGSMLPMSGDYIYVAPYAHMMIHNYSGGAYGKGHEVMSRVTFDELNLNLFFKETFNTFLTKKEIKMVLAGGDLYINADDIMVRWNKLLKKREAAFEEYQKEELAASIESAKAYIAEHSLS